MSGVDDLVAFCRARYDEDERAATHACGTIPLRRPGDGKGHARSRRLDEHTLDMYSAWFRPERMLRDIEAKRRALDRAELVWKHSSDPVEARAWSDFVRFLALPYSGHYDYRDDWQPPT